jgi:hypothetical protein
MESGMAKHPATPMRGNQLAAALSKAGVVKNDVDPTKNQPFTPAEVDEKALLRDLRDWLARMVAGERVSTSKISDAAPRSWLRDIVGRMKARGYVTIKMGSGGGSVATSKLVDLARTDVSDATLRAIALEDLSDDEWLAAEQYGVIPGMVERQAAPERNMPAQGQERDQLFVESLRNWLLRGTHGEKLHARHMLGAKTSMVYIVSPHLQAAGLVERCGMQGNWWFEVPSSQRQRVRDLTDADLVSLIWPARVEPPHMQTEGADLPPDDAGVSAPVAAASEDDPVARMLDQLLQVLTRMDKRFDRLERALGMPPLELEEQLQQQEGAT